MSSKFLKIGHLTKYSPSQPRDPDGEFASDGEGHAHAEKIAQRMVETAQLHEPAITKNVVGAIAQSGGRQERPDTAVKQVDRLTKKIYNPDNNDETKSRTKADNYEHAANIKDGIRYTAVYDEDKMTGGVKTVLGRMAADGYTPIKVKNFFKPEGASAFRGIISTFQDPRTGQKFEIQFHTPASLRTAMEQHHVYKSVQYLPQDDPRYISTQQSTRAAFSQVPDPPGIESIGVPTIKMKKDVIIIV